MHGLRSSSTDTDAGCHPQVPLRHPGPAAASGGQGARPEVVKYLLLEQESSNTVRPPHLRPTVCALG